MNRFDKYMIKSVDYIYDINLDTLPKYKRWSVAYKSTLLAKIPLGSTVALLYCVIRFKDKVKFLGGAE